MGDETRRLIELIDLVADGRGDVDWQAIEDAAPDESLRQALRELRKIAGVSAVQASQVADESPVGDASTKPAGAGPVAAAGRADAPPLPPAPSAPPSFPPDNPPDPETWGNFRIV